MPADPELICYSVVASSANPGTATRRFETADAAEHYARREVEKTGRAMRIWRFTNNKIEEVATVELDPRYRRKVWTNVVNGRLL